MKAKAYIVHQAMCEPKLEWSKPKDCLSAEPLYTTQSQRTWVGLTPEDYDAMRPRVPYIVNDFTFADVAAIVEAKLKEKNT